MSVGILGPFPVLPITRQVVNGMIRSGWFPTTCPICREAAATWYRGDALQSRFVCIACQRFTLTIPAHSTIATWHRHPTPDARARIAGLSLWASRSIEPLIIDVTSIWPFSEAGRRLLSASRSGTASTAGD